MITHPERLNCSMVGIFFSRTQSWQQNCLLHECYRQKVLEPNGTKGTFRAKSEVRGTVHMLASQGMDPERNHRNGGTPVFPWSLCASQLRWRMYLTLGFLGHMRHLSHDLSIVIYDVWYMSDIIIYECVGYELSQVVSLALKSVSRQQVLMVDSGNVGAVIQRPRQYAGSSSTSLWATGPCNTIHPNRSQITRLRSSPDCRVEAADPNKYCHLCFYTWIYLCNHNSDQDTEHFHQYRKLFLPLPIQYIPPE